MSTVLPPPSTSPPPSPPTPPSQPAPPHPKGANAPRVANVGTLPCETSLTHSTKHAEFYIIINVHTGVFMPDFRYKAGYTHHDFITFNGGNLRYPCVPRLFSTYDRASRALRAYLQGEHEPKPFSAPGRVGRVGGMWFGPVQVRPNTQRNPSDYAITKLRMEIL